MSVQLNAETERRIEDHVSAGEFASADEVIRAALRLLEERDRKRAIQRDEIRKKIAVGLEQLERGEGIDGEKVFADLLSDLECDGEAA
jgi:antitoxin ParD1/3/4